MMKPIITLFVILSISFLLAGVTTNLINFGEQADLKTGFATFQIIDEKQNNQPYDKADYDFGVINNSQNETTNTLKQ